MNSDAEAAANDLDSNPNAPAPNEEDSNSGSSTSSSSRSESGRPPFKRKAPKEDPRIEALMNQVGFLSNLYVQSLCTSQHNNDTTVSVSTPNESFLAVPKQHNSSILDLGQITTNIDETKFIKPALPERVTKVKSLQHFGLPTWQNVRYSKALQSFAATPGFTELRVNDELCQLSKSKDYLAGTENIMAALSNAMFESNDLLRAGLQSVVDWAFNSPEELKGTALVDKMSAAVGTGSPFYKNTENILQVLCGKRSESIETRRERLIKEIPNKCIQLALRNIPPSETCLFDQSRLNALIQNFGGPQQWIHSLGIKEFKNPGTSLKRKGPDSSSYPTTSSAPKKFKNEVPRRNFHQNNNFKTRGKGKGVGKRSSFRPSDQFKQ